ncbi:serine hydrolase [Lusitaniella coriacea LEGE 07157]|uniref:Serine hydrolase n=1 Tax=Lusitaniella coriacea LEGE 07157 TaxID=945747 RepID=A0A8J7JAS9_9CYAN|nr:serine hydrolase [Lusitaniella coriacea]MBE9116530.1 serine hydrolase [Lusitaniella coriacea LEGE 07157]
MTFFRKDDKLEQLGTEVLEAIWSAFPGLTRTQIAMTWIVYDLPAIVNTGGAISPEEFWTHSMRGFSYRGVERIYPASVVKLFYLVAIHEWLERGMVASSKELERAIGDAIADSSNDATSLLVDVLTGTTSGPELPEEPFKTWQNQRNIVNRYFQSLGWQELEGINVNQKTWGDGPYGRERAFLGELMDNRNMLTTDAVAKLLHAIVGGVAVSGARSRDMMALLQRSLQPVELEEGEENQVQGFLGEGLPQTARLWSKAGWTSKVRHDAVYVEIRDRAPFLLVVFIENATYSQDKTLLPYLMKTVLAAQEKLS